MARYKYLRREVVGDKVVTKSQAWYAKRGDALRFLTIAINDYGYDTALDLYARVYGHKLTPAHLQELMKSE